MSNLNGKGQEATATKNNTPHTSVEKSSTTIGSNGQVKSEEKKQADQEKAKPQEVLPVIIPEAKAEAKTLSVDEILQKAAAINTLNENRIKLDSHLRRVKAMKFTDFGESDVITLSVKNENYLIANSRLCKMVSELITSEIQAKLNEVDNSIREAAI